MRDVNWGCLLFLAAALAVDALLFLAARSLAAWLAMVAGFAAVG